MKREKIMSLNSRQELTESYRKEYQQASKVDKGKLLNSLCMSCNYHRKHAIRLLTTKFKRESSRNINSGRPPTYNDYEIRLFLEDLKRQTNLICSRRLKEAIPDWVDCFDKFYLNKDVRKKLLHISPATIDRILKKAKFSYERIGLSTTKPGTILKKQIKINTNQWEENRPGYMECDTVAHCGTNIAGNYVHSVNAVDIATLWIETRAIWNKTQEHTVNAVKSIEEALPFKLKGFDTDNGSEFINWHMINYLTKRKKKVVFTRSRAYKKNDNAHIEGRNWTHVRQYLGYSRFDDIRLLDLLNDIYKNEWSLFFNYFIPSQKCVSKIRMGSKIKKTYGKAKTPYQRVLDHEFIPEYVKKKLKSIRKKLNPYKLQKSMFDKIIIVKQISMECETKIAK